MTLRKSVMQPTTLGLATFFAAMGSAFRKICTPPGRFEAVRRLTAACDQCHSAKLLNFQAFADETEYERNESVIAMSPFRVGRGDLRCVAMQRLRA